MFTVKATYRNETRKFSFQDLPFFPTYDQIYHQLYRVFPISHNYYLSKLLFSPDSERPSRILIGWEVHSAEEYVACLAPFQGLSWSSALLRFSVFDETPHKIPSFIMTNGFQMPGVANDSNGIISRDKAAFPSPKSVSPSASSANSTPLPQGVNQPPVSMFHIPPPPIIYSSSPFTPSQAPMDIDTKPTGICSPFIDTAYSSPRRNPHVQQMSQLDKPPCCSVAQGKLEVVSALTSFKDDLDHIISKYFPPSPSSHSSHPCHPCQPPPVGSYHRDLPVPPTLPPWRAPPYCPFTPPVPAPIPNASTSVFTPFIPPGCSTTCVPPCMYPPYSNKPTASVATFSHLKDAQPDCTTPVVPFIPGLTQLSTSTERVLYPPIMSPIVPRIPPNETTSDAPPIPAQPPTPVPPLVHVGVSCNLCNNTIVGTRHKCLDCPDYDLCSACMNAGAAGRHNPFHEFFDIEEPGRVVVHTVFSGDGERDAFSQSTRRNGRADNVQATTDFTVMDMARTHNACCDLCDSRIIGIRYKCLVCPDFDTCMSCFSITDEQHPNHSFVKVTNPDDFLSRSMICPVRHYATCDECGRGINGARYKCMHPECPDFDLCDVCEAHPIPVHPPNHPMLKMKSADTVIPTVYRVGQTTVIACAVDESRLKREEGMRIRSPSRSISPVRSYSRGYLHNPFADSRSRSPPCNSSRRSRSPLPFVRHYTDTPQYIRRSLSRSRSRSPDLLRSSSRLRMRYYDSSRSRSPSRIVRYVSRSPSPQTINYERQSSPQIIGYEQQRSSSPCRDPSLLMVSSGFTPHHDSDRSATLCHRPSRVRSRSNSRSRSWTPPSFKWESSPTVAENEPILIHLGEPENEAELRGKDTEHDASETITPQANTETKNSTSAISLASSSTSGSESASQFKLPPLAPHMDLFREFWPRVAQELRHLMQEQETTSDNMTQLTSLLPSDNVVNPASQEAAVIESPLTGEALLKRPDASSVQPEMIQSNLAHAPFFSRSLAALLNASSPPTQPSPLAAVANDEQSVVAPDVTAQAPQQETEVTMSAIFVTDNDVPDSQVFPPGAEFVKSWRMLNDGTKAWPETTVLELIVGESFARDQQQVVKVGSVAPGAVIDLWTGELKAPETSGHYVSYWRLHDGLGNMFGHTVWIDITVAEQSKSESADSSLASSSIIMPQSAPAKSSAPSDIITDGTVAMSTPVITSLPRFDDAVSDNGSDGSSVSLISIPSSDDDDPTIWEDSRSHAVSLPPSDRARARMEYVVLYDDSSSDEA